MKGSRTPEKEHQEVPKAFAHLLSPSPSYPAYHEHKHTQKFCQALSGQEAADPEPALDFCQELNVGHSEESLSLVTTPSVCIGALLLHREACQVKR